MRSCFLTAAAVLLSAGAANAEGGFISLMGGPTFTPALSLNGGKAGTDTGFNGGFRAGYGLDDWNLSGFSIDADVFFNQSHYSGTFAKRRSMSFMGDLMYHFSTGTPFGLYGGAGLGAVNTDYQSPTVGGDSTVFGWQVIGGVEYKFSPETTLFTEYRYQNAHNANAGVAGVGNTSNNVSVGVKFNL
jgi:opacity protein-like surface antigen